MASATSPFFRDTAFDPFLFAAVGEERNGMLLSVVSALARLDLDPWREAASLSKLSAPAATERLSSLLSSLPNTQLQAPAPAAITRLIGLLPKAARDQSWNASPAVATKTRISWPLAAILILALLMMCAVQFMSRRESGAPSPGEASPAASAHDFAPPKARGE